MTKTAMISVFALLLAARGTAAQTDRHLHVRGNTHSMRDEHEEMLWKLEDFSKGSDRVATAARALMMELKPHFGVEERIALPPIGLAQRLVETKEVAGLQSWLLPITDSLAAVVPVLIADHKRIDRARLALRSAARSHDAHAVVALTDDLARHMQSEEELYFPLGLLVGEIVRKRM